MKAKRIKAVRMLRNDMTGEVYRTCAPWQKRFAHRVYVLPADAESYERMVEQVAKAESDYALSTCGEGQDWNEDKCARQILRAIGITAPKKGTK